MSRGMSYTAHLLGAASHLLYVENETDRIWRNRGKYGLAGWVTQRLLRIIWLVGFEDAKHFRTISKLRKVKEDRNTR
jgi:hypothetical protein